MSLTTSQTDFLNRIYPHAKAASDRTGIDPYVIMSQAALESGFGQHAPNNNFFGIKGPGGTQTTTEYVNGKPVTINDSFRGYADLGASVSGWADFITGNRRYKPVMAADNPLDQIALLGKSGYATDPNYTNKLSGLFHTITSQFSGGSDKTGGNFRGSGRHTA